MTEKTQLFQFAGERPAEKTEAEKKKKWYQDRPVAAELFLGLLVLGCLFCRQIMTKDPSYWNFSYFCRHVIANNLNFIGNLR